MASAAGEDTVRASHILIKHEGSRRKASWKDPEGRVISATTRADAAARLGELRDQILSGRGSFADLAAQHSDCSSARRGGDLGTRRHSPHLCSPLLVGQELDLDVSLLGIFRVTLTDRSSPFLILLVASVPLLFDSWGKNK
jgi:NIMA-interacting peptidyl-prolyl cis-trans isomerase 1